MKNGANRIQIKVINVCSFVKGKRINRAKSICFMWRFIQILEEIYNYQGVFAVSLKLKISIFTNFFLFFTKYL